MPSEKNAFIEIAPAPMPLIAYPGDRSRPEASMSYAMITIGSSVGHLAAGIFSALAYGLRFLSAPAQPSERRSRASYGM
jgi:hypothetical protein